MANLSHISKLNEGVEAWNEWRQKNPHIIPDLSRESDGNIYDPFDDINADSANFEDVDFSNCRFRDISLQNTNCKGANFYAVDFVNVELKGAVFDGAKLPNATFLDCDLRDCTIGTASFANTKFHRCRFTGMNLSLANWTGAQFHNTNLQAVDFENVSLTYVTIAESDLRRCSFKGGTFTGTKFSKNDFHEIELRDSNFSNAEFSDDNISLAAEHFGGTNLLNAKLPDDIKKFGALEHVAETSKHARNVFLALVGACFYTLLTTLTTTDVGLLTNSAGTPLPIINAAMPAAYFYMSVPYVLLILYFYLHFYLQTMWEELSGLPAIFDDGRRLDMVAYPWLLTSMVPRYVHFLRGTRLGFSTLKEIISLFAAYGLVPLTIFRVWYRYLPAHDISGDIFIGMACAIVTVFGLYSFFKMRVTLVTGEGHAGTKRVVEKLKRMIKSRPKDFMTDYAVPVLLASTLMGAATVMSWYSLTNSDSKSDFADYFNANLKDRAASTKPTNWQGIIRNDISMAMRGGSLTRLPVHIGTGRISAGRQRSSYFWSMRICRRRI